MRKNAFILVIVALFSINLFAQKAKESNPLRFEINIGNNSTEESPCVLINCKERGLAACYIVSAASSNDSLVFVLKHLDVNMEQVNEVSFTLSADYYIRAHTYSNANVYVVMSTSTTKRSATDVMTVKFNLESNETEILTANHNLSLNVNELAVTNDVALVSLIDRKNKHHLLTSDFNTKNSTFKYSSTEELTYNVLSLVKYPEEENVYVSITQKTNVLYSLNVYECSKGSFQLRHTQTLGDSVFLTYAAPLKNIDGKIQTLVGAYFSGNIKNLYSSSGYGVSSSGVFTIDVNKSSLNLLPHRQVEKDIYCTWHQPVRCPDADTNNTSYIFTVEAYSPKFKVTPHTDYDFYGRPYTRYYQEFVGYTTLQAINYIFEITGNLSWICSTEVENTINTNIPVSKVFVDIVGDEILNAYFAKESITYKFIDYDHRFDPFDKFFPAKKYERDVVENEYNSRIEHWYDDFYLVYGYQIVRNNSINKNNRRTVFYVQKITL